MGIARSTFYDKPQASGDDTALVEAMHAIKDEFEAYGWRRMQAALRQQGWAVNHKKIRRLMREHGLQPPWRRRFVVTTDSDHDQPIFPNRTRELAIDGPDQLWVADLTYVAVAIGFVYIAAIALDHGATIDKYVGDAIVIFFGDPETRGVKEDAIAWLRNRHGGSAVCWGALCLVDDSGTEMTQKDRVKSAVASQSEYLMPEMSEPTLCWARP